MTHQKKKMIKRNHKKLSPRSKKITMGAASVLLGTGLMLVPLRLRMELVRLKSYWTMLIINCLVRFNHCIDDVKIGSAYDDFYRNMPEKPKLIVPSQDDFNDTHIHYIEADMGNTEVKLDELNQYGNMLTCGIGTRLAVF